MPRTASTDPTHERSTYLIVPVPTPEREALFYRVEVTNELADLVRTAARALMTADAPNIASVATHLGPRSNASLVSTLPVHVPSSVSEGLRALAQRAAQRPERYVLIDASEYPDPEREADVGESVWVNVYGPDAISFEAYWGDTRPNSFDITIALD